MLLRKMLSDKYQDISAKDHKRMRRAGEVVIDYDLSIASHLPKRDAIMKSKWIKQTLASVLGTFDLGVSTTMETCDDCTFLHDEADITMVSFVLEAAKSGQSLIHVLSDNTDVFVLLVYWVNWANVQRKIQMEHWGGSVLDINATCADLGQKCLQLPGMHAFSGCDTNSYPIGKGKFGIVQGRGTTEAIFVVRQLQEKYLAAIKRLYMVFVDLEKYFMSPGHPTDIGWYWLTVGIGLLSLQQVRVEGGCVYFFFSFTFIHFPFSPVPLFPLLSLLSPPFLWETTQNDPQGLTCR